MHGKVGGGWISPPPKTQSVATKKFNKLLGSIVKIILGILRFFLNSPPPPVLPPPPLPILSTRAPIEISISTIVLAI